MMEVVYALYRGDEFLDIGTAEELAERRGVRPETIRFMSTNSHKGRTDYEKTVWAYRVDDGERHAGRPRS